MRALLTLLLALALPGLQAEPEGRLHQLGPFDSISLNGSASVRFVQGERDEVFVEGDEERQSEIRLEVVDGRLQVRTRGAWKFWRDAGYLRLQISARELRRLAISGGMRFHAPQPVQAQQLLVSLAGAGQVRFDQLQAEELRFDVAGSGSGQFAGRVEQFALAVAGHGDFRGEQLQIQQARVAINGMGKARLWVEQELNLAITGVGRIDYWGQPRLIRHGVGLDRVRARGERASAPN